MNRVLLIFIFLIACGPPDKDSDGIPDKIDCSKNSSNPTELTKIEDKDCDGFANEFDCYPNDYFSHKIQDKKLDNDCDNVSSKLDCNDQNPTVTYTNTNDKDCDLIQDDEDCDPNDPKERKQKLKANSQQKNEKMLTKEQNKREGRQGHDGRGWSGCLPSR